MNDYLPVEAGKMKCHLLKLTRSHACGRAFSIGQAQPIQSVPRVHSNKLCVSQGYIPSL